MRAKLLNWSLVENIGTSNQSWYNVDINHCDFKQSTIMRAKLLNWSLVEKIGTINESL